MTEQKALTLQSSNLPSTGNIFFNVSRFEHAQRVSKMLSTSTMMPEHFKNNIGNCMILLNFSDRLGADPFMLAQNMCIIHNKPGLEAKLIIALVNNCGRFEPVEFEEVGNLNKPDNDEDGCIAYAKDLKSGKTLKGPKIDWRMVKAEGWYGKKGSKWQTMAPLMFRYRSAAYFARVYCPEVTLGLQTNEEIIDAIDVSPVSGGQWEVPQDQNPSEQFDLLIPTDIEKAYFDQWLSTIAKKSNMTLDQAKAEVMKEDDFDNCIDNFRKHTKKLHSTFSQGMEKKDNGPNTDDSSIDNASATGVDTGDDYGNEGPWSESKWRNLKGPGVKQLAEEHRDSFVQLGQDTRKAFQDKWARCKELDSLAFPFDSNGNWIGYNIDLVEKFNAAWSESGDTAKEARLFASEELGLELTVNGYKRPPKERFSDWLQYFNEYKDNINNVD